MRAEDKDLENAELEHEELRERDLAADDKLREVAGEEVVDVREVAQERETDRQKLVVGTIRALFENKTVTVSILGLPEREANALEALQSAITAKAQTGEFVFADDRRDLLEQALAILQPNLTNAAPELLAELGSMEKLTDKVASLRKSLGKLEDAQEVIPEWEKDEWFGEGAAEGGDTDDKPKPKPESSEPIEVGSIPSSLSTGGPEAPEPVEPPSTLERGGPAAPELPAQRESELGTGGPEAPTVGAALVSTLDTGGPEAEHPEVASSLYDEDGPRASGLGPPETSTSRIGGRIANAAKAAAGFFTKDADEPKPDDDKPGKKRRRG